MMLRAFGWAQRLRPPRGGLSDPPGRMDLLVLLIPVVLGAGMLSAKHAWDAHGRVVAATRDVQGFREDLLTRRFELDGIEEAKSRAQKEQNLPHPTLQDRDAQFIGNHTTVSWTYGAEDRKSVV